tara:strand:- start:100 stop:315 length:216 start_codon:yes stop_codon:yes gene_type:complete
VKTEGVTMTEIRPRSIKYFELSELSEKEKVVYILEKFAESGTQLDSTTSRKAIAEQIMKALKDNFNPYLGV